MLNVLITEGNATFTILLPGVRWWRCIRLGREMGRRQTRIQAQINKAVRIISANGFCMVAENKANMFGRISVSAKRYRTKFYDSQTQNLLCGLISLSLKCALVLWRK
jgi:hypothetical protein